MIALAVVRGALAAHRYATRRESELASAPGQVIADAESDAAVGSCKSSWIGRVPNSFWLLLVSHHRAFSRIGNCATIESRAVNSFDSG